MENATIVDVIDMTRFEAPMEGEPYFQIRWMLDGEVWDDLEWKVLSDIFKFDHGPTFFAAFQRYNDLVGPPN